MTDKPIDKYIKSPPPTEPDSHFRYLEEQFTKIENVTSKHVDAIVTTASDSKALVDQEAGYRVKGDEENKTYTLKVAADTYDKSHAELVDEINVRTTETSALAEKVTTLQANVGDLSGKITEETRVRVDETQSLAEKNLRLETTFKYSKAAYDLAISTLSDDTQALSRRIETLTASVDANSAAITNEATVRATADTAEATQRSALQSYVGWNGGSYTANLTQTMNTKVSKTDGASYEWSVKGSFGTASTGASGLRLQGAQRLNSSTGLLETTSNLIIDANTIINGSLLINGSVTVNSDGSSPLAAGAISDSSVGFGLGAAGVYVTSKTASDSFLIVATYAGGDTRAVSGIGSYLQIQQNGSNIGSAPPIMGFAISGASSTYVPASPNGWYSGTVVMNYQTGSVTAVAKATAGSVGSLFFAAYSGLSAPVAIYVIRLSR